VVKPILIALLALAILSLPSSGLNISGTSDDVVAFSAIGTDPRIFNLEYSGASNFAVVLKDSQGNWMDLLANEIGPYTGITSAQLTSGNYYLDIIASGPWSIGIVPSVTEISPPIYDTPSKLSGFGNDVVAFSANETDLRTFNIEYSGTENFVLVLEDGQGNWIELLANEVGPYTGSTSVQLATGNYSLNITASGPWSVEIVPSVTITTINHVPIAADVTNTTNEATPVQITLNATDPDGDTMTYSIGSGPSNGTLGTISGNKVVYTPNANYTGIDSFSFRVNDGNGDSNTAMVTITVEPNYSLQLSHVFYGNVTINGEPAREYTIISAVGPGVRSNITGNPVAVQTNSSYGSTDVTTQRLVVQGDIDDGALITFYVDGIQAEVYDVNTSGPWQFSYPFRSGEMTNLNIRVTPTIPPPDKVYINAIDVTITNSTMGYLQTIKVEQNPSMELRVTKGVFDVEISATGYHVFNGLPDIGRYAILGIYENGTPVSPEIKVPFGSRMVSYEYVPTKTRTFDLRIYVNESPEIYDVKQITVYVGYSISATAGPGGSISPAGQVLVDAHATQRFDVSPSYGYQIDDVIVDGQSKGAVTNYTFSNVHSDHQIHATFSEVPPIFLDSLGIWI